MNLNNKKVLVTGAAGFVGANLLRKLLSYNDRVSILIRSESNLWRINDLLKKVSVITSDLSTVDQLKKQLSKVKPDIIFHLITPDYHNLSFGDQIQGNILGTYNLLHALEDIDYKLFVNTGTSSEYGPKDHPMKEDDFLNPKFAYAAAKAATTLLSSAYSSMKNKPVVTLRLFSVYGPFEHKGRFISSIISQALKNQTIEVTGGDEVRDFIFVDDVVEAYLACTKLDNFDKKIFNICSSTQTSIAETAKLVVNLCHSSSRITKGTYTPRLWDTNIWVGDNHLAKKTLGWQPKHSLKEGLLETINWFKNNQQLYD